MPESQTNQLRQHRVSVVTYDVHRTGVNAPNRVHAQQMALDNFNEQASEGDHCFKWKDSRIDYTEAEETNAPDEGQGPKMTDTSREARAK